MIYLTMTHECTGTSLSVADASKIFTYNYVLKDPDMIIALTGTDSYLVKSGEYPELISANINCFEYFLYE